MRRRHKIICASNEGSSRMSLTHERHQAADRKHCGPCHPSPGPSRVRLTAVVSDTGAETQEIETCLKSQTPRSTPPWLKVAAAHTLEAGGHGYLPGALLLSPAGGWRRGRPRCSGQHQAHPGERHGCEQAQNSQSANHSPQGSLARARKAVAAVHEGGQCVTCM